MRPRKKIQGAIFHHCSIVAVHRAISLHRNTHQRRSASSCVVGDIDLQCFTVRMLQSMDAVRTLLLTFVVIASNSEAAIDYGGLAATMGCYPGYDATTGNTQNTCVTGTLQVDQAIEGNASSGVRIYGSVQGLSDKQDFLCDVNNPCGIHVHDGFTCEDASLVGGHYMQMTPDPWASTTYDSSAIDVTSTSLDIKYVAGRTVVIHDRRNRIGCGVIQYVDTSSLFISTATIVPYPDYTQGTARIAPMTDYDTSSPGYDVSGDVKVEFSGSQGSYTYSLFGLAADQQGGIHVHVGRTCDPAHVGGHYYKTASDPWVTTTWQSDSQGASSGTIQVDDGFSADQHVSHAVVVHDHLGVKAACGTLIYAPSVQGYIFIETILNDEGSETGELKLTANLGGLERLDSDNEQNVKGEFHVHAGCSCDTADQVKGHLYSYVPGDNFNRDPWNRSNIVNTGLRMYEVEPFFAASDKGTNAQADASLEYAKGQSFAESSVLGYYMRSVCGHAVVVHDSDYGRIGCGIVTGTFCDDQVNQGFACTPTPAPGDLIPTPTPTPRPRPSSPPSGGGGGPRRGVGCCIGLPVVCSHLGWRGWGLVVFERQPARTPGRHQGPRHWVWFLIPLLRT